MQQEKVMKVEIVDNPNPVMEALKFLGLFTAIGLLVGIISSSSQGVQAVGAVVEGYGSPEATIGLFTLLKWAIQLGIFAIVVGISMTLVLIILKSAGVLAWLCKEIGRAASALGASLGLSGAGKKVSDAASKVASAMPKIPSVGCSGALRSQVYGYKGDQPVLLKDVIHELRGEIMGVVGGLEALKRDIAGPISTELDEFEARLKRLEIDVFGEPQDESEGAEEVAPSEAASPKSDKDLSLEEELSAINAELVQYKDELKKFRQILSEISGASKTSPKTARSTRGSRSSSSRSAKK